MFILSVKKTQIKRALLITAVIAAAAVLLFVLYGRKDSSPAAKSADGIVFRAENEEERQSFISQFGWKADAEPVEVTEVFIPEEFDEVYEQYNDIQKKDNGLDLSKYKGKRVKRWTYAVTNYPGYENSSDCVRINLLVYSGLVIGGDVCSVEMDGFMHGFTRVAG
ncbi:MAG: DUF4830 domain-containing protein [Clostridia bacterium]|nr:DUF4830 domain-containing protein [Clostridia bacterium]